MNSTRAIRIGRMALLGLICIWSGSARAASTYTPVADAYVQAGTNAAKNYGTATTLNVRTSTTTANNYDSYLRYDLGAQTGVVATAKLRLYAALSATGSVATSAYAVSSTTWGETTITWNNKPARGSALGSATVNKTTYAWYEVDVSAYVKSELAAGRKIVGFAYHDAANTSPYIKANSREAANKPQLVITPDVAPTVSLTAPTSGAVYTAPGTIALTASAADSDGTVAKVDFYNGATLIGTATAAPYSFTWANVPTGTYSLSAIATDNLGVATTSAAVAVTVDVPPTIALTAPANGAVYIAPAAIALAAAAADPDGSVAKVDFYNGATLLGTATAAPYAFAWNNVPAGSYSLSAKVTDNLGTITASAPVAITVNNNTPPSINLTAPANNAIYLAPAAITLTANAADSDGSVARVDFYNGAALLGTVTAAPYTYAWANVPSGTYSVTATATDDRGASTTSAAATVTVNTQPTVTLTAPTEGTTYTAPAGITLTANATDSDGNIARVDFYNGATLIGSATAAPYTFAWTNVPAGTYALTAQATDNLGAAIASATVNVTVNDAVVGAGVYYIYADQLNTPRAITDSSNKVIWRWDSDPFGTTPADEDPDKDGVKMGYNLRFPGQYYDKETGLHYNYYRDYDPSAGRYVESDPIGLEGGQLSTYTYVNGNPISLTDPTGEGATGARIGGTITGTIVGAVGAETGPLDPILIMGARAAGAAIGSAIEDLCKSDCTQLEQEIKQIANGIRQRYFAMLDDPLDLYSKALCDPNLGKRKGTYVGHAKQIEEQKNRLRKKIAEADAKGCKVDLMDRLLLGLNPPSCPAN
jgi:RHS repeat-associated protein